MATKYKDLIWLERKMKNLISQHQEVAFRITETPCWYNIQIEYEGGDQIAYYQTSDWSEVVEFCKTHCNPGNDFMYGLGCTEPELIEATTKYIHGLEKKLWYES